MIDERFDRTDHQTGREVDVPPAVMSVVERADDVLQRVLATVGDPALHVSWCRFRNTPEDGWTVALDVYTPRYGYGQQLRVDQLRDLGTARELIWQVLGQFSRGLSKETGDDLRKLRHDLKAMLASSGV